ncbi:MAG TPA: divalent cation tolerance protein CutA, partial [Anaerolineae bacterium]|nr:divalent cation tolerance protein CutA [Anaerolineae bacterium]
EEWLCLIKTRADLYEQLEAVIKEVHPYDVPEILAVPVLAVSERYVAWPDGVFQTPP